MKELEIKPEFKITYNGTDVTNKKFKIDSFPCTVTLTDTSIANDGAIIRSKQWKAFSNNELTYKNIGTSDNVIYSIKENEVESGAKSFLLTLNGNNNISVSNYCWPYTEEIPDDPEPPDDNNPPIVILNAPDEVKAGEVFSARASASDPDGDPLTYIWETANAEGTPTGMYASLWYKINHMNTTQTVAVIANDCQYDGYDSKNIFVKPPTVEAKIGISGTLKENRKVVISDTSNCPRHYPITERTWIMHSISSGLSSYDIKHDGNLSSEKKEVLFKKAGKYRITLNVKNSAGYTSSTSSNCRNIF